MDQTTIEWNGHMIDQKVASYLTQRIKAIPLCRTPQEDCLRGIWSLRILNKIKHFGWRACTESLPTLANLYRRKVVSSPFCYSCDRACETTIHALWECDKVLGCWGHVFKNLRSQELGVGSFANLVFTVRKQGENMELFIVVAWFIWSRRNKMHFNEQHLPPDKILDTATALLADFHEKPDSKPGRNLIRTQRWVPPAEGMYKVIAVPRFYKSRPNQAPNLAKRAPMGNKNDGDRRDHSNTQAAPHSPPLSNRESGEERQNQSETVTLEEHQNSL
nr:hypothetical protein CFP56_43375 [Quercus suber]